FILGGMVMKRGKEAFETFRVTEIFFILLIFIFLLGYAKVLQAQPVSCSTDSDCEDNNPCTAPHCVDILGVKTCHNQNLSGNACGTNTCTFGGTCSVTHCGGDPSKPVCIDDFDCGVGGGAGEGPNACFASQCLGGTPTDCDDANPCTADACTP